MEYLLSNLIQQIKAKMPSLSTVDEDYGQLDMLDSETDTYPLTFPAVLVDAPETQWTNVSANHQKGTVTIRAKLLIDCYDDTHYGSNTLGDIASRQEVVDALHLVLQGYRPDGGAPMTRHSSRFYTSNHGIKVYEQEYTVTVNSHDATTTKKKVGPNLVVTIDKEE